MDHGTVDRDDSSARSLGMLALFSAELNSQLTLEDLTAAVLHAALVLNDADIVALANLDRAGTVSIAKLERAALHLTDDPRSGFGDRTFGGAGPAGDEQVRSVVVNQSPVPIDDLPAGVIAGCIHSARSSWMRDLSRDTVLGEVHQALGHPIRDESGAVAAVLAVGWETSVGFGAEVKSVTELFCDLTGSGLLRARHAQELADLANRMRSALLPTRIAEDRLDVAYDYVPALNTIGFGGDWFDIVRTGPDHVLLVVGDIAGHGVPAAARMALAQGAVRALGEASLIADIPLLASRALAGDGTEMVATLGIVGLDLAARTATCQLAGHPPPMLRRPDGSVVRLGGEPLPPIGMVQRAHDSGDPVPLEPGSLLVLYTDGLVEQRRSDLSDRLGELESSIAGLDADISAADALSTICDDMLTAASEDDVAILVVRLRAQR